MNQSEMSLLVHEKGGGEKGRSEGGNNMGIREEVKKETNEAKKK